METTYTDEDEWVVRRIRMVSEQLVVRGIADERVITAMREVPRHQFITKNLQTDSYKDTPVPIGAGQTISQPYIVALMTELLEIKDDDIVLEIGTGSGYHTAILARLAQRVFSVECMPELAAAARQRLDHLGVMNVEIHEGDGSVGLPDKSPFDVILVAAASPRQPDQLIDQLTSDGRLIIPVGSRHKQRLQLWAVKQGKAVNRVLTAVRFVPLTGKWGWENEPER